MEFFVILLGMVILLLLKGFFSGSEIALVNSDKLKLHHRANQGDRGAKLVLKLFRSPDVLLGTTLVGTNISTVALTTIGTMIMISHFGEWGDLYAFVLFTPLFLILGEIVPKSVYQQNQTPWQWLSFSHYGFFRCFFPLSYSFFPAWHGSWLGSPVEVKPSRPSLSLGNRFVQW